MHGHMKEKKTHSVYFYQITPCPPLEDSKIFPPAPHSSFVNLSVLQSKQKSFVTWLFNSLDLRKRKSLWQGRSLCSAATDYTLRWLNVRPAGSCQPFRLPERMRFPSTSWVSLHECKPDRTWDLRACVTSGLTEQDNANVCVFVWASFHCFHQLLIILIGVTI